MAIKGERTLGPDNLSPLFTQRLQELLATLIEIGEIGDGNGGNQKGGIANELIQLRENRIGIMQLREKRQSNECRENGHNNAQSSGLALPGHAGSSSSLSFSAGVSLAPEP